MLAHVLGNAVVALIIFEDHEGFCETAIVFRSPDLAVGDGRFLFWGRRFSQVGFLELVSSLLDCREEVFLFLPLFALDPPIVVSDRLVDLALS